jgi:uncharacterized protein (TIGR01777 family)
MPPVVAISGSSGLIGSALVPALEAAGYGVRRLVRRAPATPDEVQWTPSARLLDERRLAGVDVIVNLSGETIGRRWTAARRRAIRDSRLRATETIVGAILRGRRPITLINASAVGYYGSRGDEKLDERSSNGRGYLAEVCRDWEMAARGASVAGSRIVMMRNGVVLSSKGGGLPEMLRPFRFGVGGRIGNGRQWLSWIDLDDVVRAIRFVIEHEEIRGPVNVVAPNPVTNREFTSIASDVLNRPAFMTVPAFALRLAFGEMANETLLASQRAFPGVLSSAGFEFEFATIRESLLKDLPRRSQ